MKRAASIVALLALSGCKLGPDYRRPPVPLAATFRGQAGDAGAAREAGSFADLPFWALFSDDALLALLRESLAGNLDLAAAAERVVAAREIANVRTDALLPTLGVQAGGTYQQVFSPFAPTDRGNVRYGALQLGATLAWEVDLWGRLRRLREAALADFLASEENRRGVVVALIGGVAEAYFNLLALDLQRDIATRAAESRRQTLELFTRREQGGVGDRLQTASAEANLENALAAIPNLERQIAEAENNLCLLLGRTPAAIRRTSDLLVRPAPPPRPLGAPSALLERRPDIRAAEARAISGNAQVGAAFAALFPGLTVTGNGGFGSASPAALFTVGALTFGAGLLLNWLAPILNGAQLRHQHRAQQAFFRAAVADYQRAVLNAQVEVATALAAMTRLREVRAHQQAEVTAREETVHLAKLRFQNGVASYLDVVQAEQNLFPAQLTLAQTIGAQFVTEVRLYRALGGGWLPAPGTR